MELDQVIRQLLIEREILDIAIAELESLENADPLSGGRAPFRNCARTLIRPPHEEHVGHNPLGGWMVIALLALLLLQAVTGLFSNDDIATDGPLTRWISKDLSDRISGIHKVSAWVLVTMAAMHVAAALSYLVLFRENLIRPMVTGLKSISGLPPSDDAGNGAVSAKAIVLLAACAGAVWLLARGG